jgi:hypothetical protein
VLFSGGVDSVLVAVALHMNLPLATRVVLVNVAFAQDAFDRLQSQRAFQGNRSASAFCACVCGLILILH